MFTLQDLIALPALAGLAIVLGINNVLALSIITAKLEPARRSRALFIGLGLSCVFRILVLLGIVWVLNVSQFTVTLFGLSITINKMLQLACGVFLITKAVTELRDRTSPNASYDVPTRLLSSFRSVIMQILIIDLLLAFDTVVMLVGMTDVVGLMIAAILIEVSVILFFAKGVSSLLARFPSIETLAICALMLVGIVLAAEGLGHTIGTNYVYAMMAFALFVEVVNLRIEEARRIRDADAPVDRSEQDEEPGTIPPIRGLMRK